MKTCAFLAIALVATALHSVASAAPFSMRGLQQGGGPNLVPQNGFPRNNLGGWQPQANVGSPWGNQNAGNAGFSPEASPQNGQVLNEQLPRNSNGAAPVDGLEQTTAAPPATEPATTTEAPQAGGKEPSGAVQPTIMVLLPDFLAPSHSGSGSMMVIAGSSSSKDTETGGPKPASDENVKTSGAAAGSLSTVTTALNLGGLAIGSTPQRWLEQDGSPRSRPSTPSTDAKPSTSRDSRSNWHPSGLDGHPWRLFQDRNAALSPKEFPHRSSIMSERTVETTGVALSTEREHSPVNIDNMLSEYDKERIHTPQRASSLLHPGFLSQDHYGSDTGAGKQVGGVEMTPSHEGGIEQIPNSAAEKLDVSVVVGVLAVYLVVTHVFA